MEDVLDLEEAAKYLKLSKQTIYKFVRAGTLPAFRLGRSWRFHIEMLDKWVREQVETDTSERKTTSRNKKACSK